jgi:hypothetical protein
MICARAAAARSTSNVMGNWLRTVLCYFDDDNKEGGISCPLRFSCRQLTIPGIMP